MKAYLVACLWLLLVATQAAGQEGPVEAAASSLSFKMLRAEEQYGYLANKTDKTFAERLKYIALGGNSYLTLGGEVRVQVEYFHNEAWGATGNAHNFLLLHRYMAHANLQLSPRLRIFGQLKSGFENISSNEPRPPDVNDLDLHQLFIDWQFANANGTALSVRLGRQELWYGSRRLVSVREGPNIRQTFDVVKLIAQRPNLTVDAFLSRPVSTEPGVFDDNSTDNRWFWGLYTVLTHMKKTNLDVYYLGIDQAANTFNQGTAHETRHTVGLRLWKQHNRFRHNIEAAYQFGSFGNSTISAWTLSADVDYRLEHMRFTPLLGLKTELISGDADANDGSLQTFNPLFPRGGYFGLVALIGPANLFDVHPSVKLSLTERFSVTVDCDVFWRLQTADGIYGPNGAFERGANNSNSHFIGIQPGFEMAYEFNSFLEWSAEGSYFQTGNYLEQSGPAENLFHMVTTLKLRF